MISISFVMSFGMGNSTIRLFFIRNSISIIVFACTFQFCVHVQIIFFSIAATVKSSLLPFEMTRSTELIILSKSRSKNSMSRSTILSRFPPLSSIKVWASMTMMILTFLPAEKIIELETPLTIYCCYFLVSNHPAMSTQPSSKFPYMPGRVV